MRVGNRGAASPSVEAGRPLRGRLVALGAAVLIGASVLAVATPAAAFLEFLFGGQQAPSPAPSYSTPYSRYPLDISVRPRRGARGHAEHPRHHRRELGRRNVGSPGRGEAKRSVGERPSEKSRTAGRQRSIDPERHPDWFLIDPNIRRGDILVLKSGPVVYLGGSHGQRSREDFVSLGQSRTLSRSGLRDIRMMVSGVWTPPEDGAAAGPAKERHGARR